MPEISTASNGDDSVSAGKKSEAKIEATYRRSICRYGPGCTHKNDVSHKDKFWHPSLPKLNDEQLKSQFICNECGYGTSSLSDLQYHLKKKTAWSNQSLVGCRISCLVDYKEWHEGIVTQFHKSGKHFVEFRGVNEKRWLTMKKIAFYIVERPSGTAATTMPTKKSSNGKGSAPHNPIVEVPVERADEGEFKETEEAPQQQQQANDPWVYSEEISTDYAFAQSVLFKVFGNVIQETGHLTRGHLCLTDSDRVHAQYVKGSLLYGELLPRGANKAFGSKRLDAGKAEVLFDLGMGTGKILLQAFLQFKNLKYVYGVELSAGRYKLAESAVLRMVDLLGADNYQVEISTGKYVIVTEAIRNPDFVEGEENDGVNEFAERILHMECGNMFDVTNVDIADLVMMETDVPVSAHSDLIRLLDSMHEGARLLTYLDLRRIWETASLSFRQIESNRHLSDRYPTSWSVQRGHHFYFWIKNCGSESAVAGSPSNLAATLALSSPNTNGSDPDGEIATTPYASSLVHKNLINNNIAIQKKTNDTLNGTLHSPGGSMDRRSSRSGHGPDGPDEDLSFYDDRCLPSFFSLSWLFRCGWRDRNTKTLSDVNQGSIIPLKKFPSGSKLPIQEPIDPELRKQLSAAAIAAAGLKSAGNSSSRLPVDKDKDNNAGPLSIETAFKEPPRPVVLPPPADINKSEAPPPRVGAESPSDDEVAVNGSSSAGRGPKKKSKKGSKKARQVSPRVEKSSVSPKIGLSPRDVDQSSGSGFVVPTPRGIGSASSSRRMVVSGEFSAATSTSQHSAGLYFPIETSTETIQRYGDSSGLDSNVPSPTFEECETPPPEEHYTTTASSSSKPTAKSQRSPPPQATSSNCATPSPRLSFLTAPSPLPVSTPSSAAAVDQVSPRKTASSSSKKLGSNKGKMASLSENPIDNSLVASVEKEVLSAR